MAGVRRSSAVILALAILLVAGIASLMLRHFGSGGEVGKEGASQSAQESPDRGTATGTPDGSEARSGGARVSFRNAAAGVTSASLAAKAVPSASPAGSIFGSVVDEQERPIEGATILPYLHLHDPATVPDSQSVHTNAQGEYTLEGLPSGEYEIRVSQVGYLTQCFVKLTVEGGQTTEAGYAMLKKAYPIPGRLTDPTGHGLAGWDVLVRAADPPDDEDEDDSETGALTDAGGNFTIEDGPSGTVRFTVRPTRKHNTERKYGLRFVSGEIELPEGEVAEPVVLTVATHSVKGRVVLADTRQPVAGVAVSVEVGPRHGPTPKGVGTRCVGQGEEEDALEKTGADGVFLIEAVPNGRHLFALEGKGFTCARPPALYLDGDGVLDAGDLEVEAMRIVTGRLLDAATRQPCPPLHRYDQVSVTMEGAGGQGAYGSAVPGPDGRFTLDDVPSSTVRLAFDVPGYLPLEVHDVRLRVDGPTDVGDLFAEQGCTLTGTLFDRAEGQPFDTNANVNADAEIQEVDKTFERQPVLNPSDRTGKFTARGVPRDIVSVKIRAPRYLPVTINEVPPPDAQGIIDLGRVELASGGVILGIIVDAQDVPLPVPRVRIVAPEPPAPPGGTTAVHRRVGPQVVWESDANGEGRFRAGLLASGSYKVSVTGQGFAPQVLNDVAVTSGGEPTRLRIVMSPGATLSGTLVDLNAGALGEWSVEEHAVDVDRNFMESVKTDAQGQFEIPNVPTSQAWLRFTCRRKSKTSNADMSFLSAPLKPDAGEAVFILPFGPQIVGRLVDESGTPMAGVRVDVNQGEYSRNNAPGKQGDGCALEYLHVGVESATDQTGRFSVGPVATGPTKVQFTADTMLQKNLDQLVVGVDGDCDIGDVTVQKGGVLTGRFVNRTTDAPARLEGEFPSFGGHACLPDGKTEFVSCHFEESDSTFRIGAVPADATSIVLSTGFVECILEDVQVEPGAARDLGDVALDPGVTLRFRLTVDEAGTPYSAAPRSLEGGPAPGLVRVAGKYGSGGKSWPGQNSTVGDKAGEWIFRTVPSDLTEITITPDGGEPVVIDAVPAPDAKGVVNLGDRLVAH